VKTLLVVIVVVVVVVVVVGVVVVVFQTRGPATVKTLLPTVEALMGGTSMTMVISDLE